MVYPQASTISTRTSANAPVPAIFEDYDISDIINEETYYNDPAVEFSYERAVHKFNILAGPVFVNRGGERVWFSGLDWDVQCGMITSSTRPIRDKEEYIGDMPVGKWSDYQGSTSEYRNIEMAAEDSMSGSDELGNADNETDSSSDRLSPEDYLESSMTTADTTPTTLTAPCGMWTDWRKDSAHSTEEASTPHPEPSKRSPTKCESSSPSAHRQGLRRQSSPHEKVTFVDDLQTIARRVMPGIEDSWHPSKYRVSRRMEELDVEADKILLPIPRLGSIGSVWSRISLRGW